MSDGLDLDWESTTLPELTALDLAAEECESAWLLILLDPMNEIEQDVDKENNIVTIPFGRQCPSKDSEEYSAIMNDVCEVIPTPNGG